MLSVCACSAGRPADADIAAAWTLLKDFSLAQFKGLSQQYVATASARAKLRDALLVRHSAAQRWAQLHSDADADVAVFGPHLQLGHTWHDAARSMHGMRPLPAHYPLALNRLQVALQSAAQAGF
jgi:hypothetical protein